MDGGRTEETSHKLANLKTINSQTIFRSRNNMMIVILTSDGTGSDVNFVAVIRKTKSNVNQPKEMLDATDVEQFLESETYNRHELGSLDDTYIITADDRRGPVKIEISDIDLSDGSHLVFRDGQHEYDKELQKLEGTDKGNGIVLSSGRYLYIYHNTTKGGNHRGFRLSYQKGCTIELNEAFGYISSPGFGASNYPNQIDCTWTVTPSVLRPLSISFEEFELADDDTLTLIDTSNNQEIKKFVNLNQIPSTEKVDSGRFKLVFKSSSTGNGVGFKLTYSPGCVTPTIDGSRTEFVSGGINDPKFVVRCREGNRFSSLEFEGETEVYMVCGFDGTWNRRTTPNCEAIPCPEAPAIDKGYIIESTSLSAGGKVTYKCADGYSFDRSDNFITCGNDGKWSAAPACITGTSQCSNSPAAGANMKKTTVLGDGRSYGSIVRYTCDVGYDLIGQNLLYCSDGNWDGTVPECRKLTCYLDEVENGNLVRNVANYLETLEVNCDQGYEPSNGNGRMTCESNREFTPTVTCINIDECRTGICDQDCIDLPGTYECSCGEGYIQDGNNCNDIDECLNSPCDQMCDDTVGSYTCSCHEGFVLFTENPTEGRSILPSGSTNEDGKVYRFNQSCVRKKCPDPPVYSNTARLTKKNNYYFEDTIQYKCDIGYKMEQENSGYIYCDANGAWAGPTINCIDVECEVPQVPSSYNNVGVIDPPPGTKIKYGQYITIECARKPLHFRTEKYTKTRKCTYFSNKYQLDGNLEDYMCKEISCGQPEEVPGFAYQSIKNTLGSSFQFSCQTQFKLEGKSSKNDEVVRCEEGGKWDFGDLTCIGKQCTDPLHPKLGRQVKSDYRSNQQVTFACNFDGYTLNGPDSISCKLSDDGTADFDRSVPECVDTTIPVLENCQNGNTIGINLDQPLSTILPQVPSFNDIRDNGGIKSYRVEPAWPSSKWFMNSAGGSLKFSFTATDYNNNVKKCEVFVKAKDTIPPIIQCPDDITLLYTSTDSPIFTPSRSDMRFLQDNLDKEEDLDVRFNPPRVPFTESLLNSAYPASYQELINVYVTDKANNQETCSFTVYFEADECRPEQLRQPPNSKKSCNQGGLGYACTIECNDGYRIFDNLASTTEQVSCVGPGQPFLPTKDIKCVNVEDGSAEATYIQRFAFDYTLSKNNQICDFQVSEFQANAQSTFQIINGAGSLTKECPDKSIKAILAFASDDDPVQYIEALNKVTMVLKLTFEGPAFSYYPVCSNLVEVVLKHPEAYGVTELTAFNQLTCGSLSLTNINDENRLQFEDYLCTNPNQTPQEVTVGNKTAKVCPGCPEGTKVNSNGTCTSCPTGTFSLSPNSDLCQSCGVDTSTNQPGAFSNSECIHECANGSYSFSGVPPCKKCPVNTYWSNSTACQPCPTDQITRITGATSTDDCKAKCAPGTYNPIDGYEDCMPCPYHTYSSTEGTRQCTACDATEFTTGSGKTSNSDCRPLSESTECLNKCENGVCTEGQTSHLVSCICNDGYYGEWCDQAFDPCASHPCFNGGECRVTNITNREFICDCPTSKSGDYCQIIERTCTDDYCGEGGMCRNSINGSVCHCLDGFSGEKCDKVKDLCDPNPCKNNGECTAHGNVRYSCKCPQGYEGKDCSENEDDCFSNPCHNNGTCVDQFVGTACDCSGTEYSGSSCETRVDLCRGVNCGPGVTCVPDDNNNSYICVCDSITEYRTGTKCYYSAEVQSQYSTVSKVQNNDVDLDYAIKLCDADSECNEFILVNQAGQNIFERPILSGGVAGSVGIKYTKYCVETSAPYWTAWFDSTNAQKQGGIEEESGAKVISETEITPCVDSKVLSFSIGVKDAATNPAAEIQTQDGITCDSTGGQCNNYQIKFLCDIPVERNQQCVNKNYCQSNPCVQGTCNSLTGGFSCSQCTGYTGSLCQDNIDECAGDPCKNGGKCTDKIGRFECDCSDTGYNGLTCETKILYCTDTTCKPHGNCQEQLKGYKCLCNQGYTGTECETEINFCASSPCLHGGVCQGKTGGYDCQCETGWDGDNCQNETTHCSVNLCKNGAECIEVFDNYVCKCKPNTFGPLCDSTTDLCTITKPCRNGGSCTEKDGSISCTCPREFTGKYCESRVDFCSENLETCSVGQCVPSLDSYTCECPDAYTGNHCETNVNNCASTNCPTRSTCIDMENKALCRCDLFYVGQQCNQDIYMNYDLEFIGQGRKAAAHLPYPISWPGSYLSFQLWVQFAKKDGTGTVMSIFTVGSPNSLRHKKPLIKLDERSVSLYIDDEIVRLQHDTRFNTDGKWHYLVVNINGVTKQLTMIVDTVKDDKTFTKDLPDSANLWVLLGNNVDMKTDMLDNSGFIGKLSNVVIYSQLLNFDDVTKVGNTNPMNVFGNKSPILLWSEYHLSPNVRRLSPSLVDKSCPYGFTDPNCSVHIKGKKAVEVAAKQCPNDIQIFTTSRFSVVDWDVPTFSDNANVISSVSSGASFLHDKYNIIIEATNSEDTKALCLFSIFVQSDTCSDPEDPPNGQMTCIPKPYEKYIQCSVTCSNGYKQCMKVPEIYTCGPSGSFDPPNNKLPFRVPPCGETKDPTNKVTIEIVYYLENQECNAVKDAIAREIRNSIIDLNSKWNQICGNLDCSDVEIVVTCVNTGGRRKRQAQITVEASVVMNNVEKEVTNKANPGQTEVIEDLFERLINSGEIFKYSDTVLGTEPTNPNNQYNVVREPQCLSPYTLLQGECVKCGPGTFYDSTTNSCTYCGKGSYQPDSGQESCIPCNGVTETEGSYSIDDCKTECNEGWYFDKTQNSCKKCARGYYQPKKGMFFCEECNADKTTKLEGTILESDCSNDCPPGKQIAPNNTCEDCPIGWYRFNEAGCQKCPKDFVTTTSGKLYRTECIAADNPAGTRRLENDIGIFEKCPKGTYQPNKWQDFCTNCNDSFTTTEEGSFLQSQCLFFCDKGQQEVGGQERCESCDFGFYKDNTDPGKPCVRCDAPYHTRITGAQSKLDCDLFSCDIGEQPTSGNTGCEPCPLGYFQDKKNQVNCTKCPISSHSTRETGAVSEDKCESFCESGFEKQEDKTCKKCEIGFYKDNSEGLFGACKRCPDTMYVTPTEGSVSKDSCTVLNCVEGSYIDDSTTTCKLCPRGEYTDKKYQKSCTKCNDGQSTRAEGSTEASDCETFCSSGQSRASKIESCTLCEIGYYKDNSIDLFMDCTKCPDDQYVTPAKGASSSQECNIRNCLAGSFIDGDECKDCERGTFQDENWKTSCKLCPEDKNTAGKGAKSQDECLLDCDKGKESRDGKNFCEECMIGYYKNLKGTTPCTPCDNLGDNNILISPNTGAQAKSECTKLACRAGYYPRNGVCTKCPRGEYQPERWQDSCIQCEEGKTTYFDGATNISDCLKDCPLGNSYNITTDECQKCGIGFYRSSKLDLNCQQCSIGYITLGEESVTQADCYILDCSDPGTYRDPIKNTCMDCEIGTYQDTPRQIKCKDCLPTYTTRNTKSVSVDACKLKCADGSQLNETTSTCVPCKQGFYKDSSLWTCEICPDDLTTTTTGAKRKDDCSYPTCSRGQVFSRSMNKCVTCPKNTYMDKESQFEPCTPCSFGQTTNEQTGVIARTGCKSVCESDNCDVSSEACIPDNSTTGYKCECLQNFVRQQDQCIHMCNNNVNYLHCGEHGNCVEQDSQVVCECKDSYDGDRCEIRPSAASLSDKEKNTIVIAVVTTVGGLLFIILIVVCLFVMAKRRALPSKQLHTSEYDDRASIATPSMKGYNDFPTFAINPAFASKPPSVMGANNLASHSLKSYPNPTFNGEEDRDPAVYMP